MLSYENITVKDVTDVEDYEIVHAQIEATCSIFKPAPGAFLQGKVTSKLQSSVAIQVEEYFQVFSSVPTSSSLEVGDDVSVKITSVASSLDARPQILGEVLHNPETKENSIQAKEAVKKTKIVPDVEEPPPALVEELPPAPVENIDDTQPSSGDELEPTEIASSDRETSKEDKDVHDNNMDDEDEESLDTVKKKIEERNSMVVVHSQDKDVNDNIDDEDDESLETVKNKIEEILVVLQSQDKDVNDNIDDDDSFETVKNKIEERKCEVLVQSRDKHLGDLAWRAGGTLFLTDHYIQDQVKDKVVYDGEDEESLKNVENKFQCSVKLRRLPQSPIKQQTQLKTRTVKRTSTHNESINKSFQPTMTSTAKKCKRRSNPFCFYDSDDEVQFRSPGNDADDIPKDYDDTIETSHEGEPFFRSFN